MRTALIGLLLLGLAGCTAASQPAPPPTVSADSGSASASAAVAVAVGEPRRPTPEQIAHDPRSHLLDARVTRTSDGLAVEAWWGCGVDGCRRDQAIVRVAADGAASYEPGSQRRWLSGGRPPDRPEAPPALDGLLVGSVPSLRPGVRALVGGGDGATLFPFGKAARSTDDGRTWTTYDSPSRWTASGPTSTVRSCCRTADCWS